MVGTPIGYRLPTNAVSFDAVRSGFEWDLPPTFNIAEAVLDQPPDHTDDVAVNHTDIDGGSRILSYAQLGRTVEAIAAWIDELIGSESSNVAVCLPQSPELVQTHLAVLLQGSIVVPLSTIAGTDTFQYCLEHSETEVLLIDEQVAEHHADVLSSVDGMHIQELEISTKNRAALGGFDPYVREERSFEPEETIPNDPAFILYTSGTTDKPKGVVQAHQYLIGSLPGYQLWFELFDPSDVRTQRVWTPAEWAWAGALFDVVYPTLVYGGTVVSHARRTGFDPSEAISLIKDRRVTKAFLPPTALYKIRDAFDGDIPSLPNLSGIMCGGEKLTPSLLRWAERGLDVVVNEAYGQTEANALIGSCQALFPARPGSIGRLYPGHDVEIVDDNGDPLPPGEPGELVLQASDPVRFLRYWKDPSATNDVLTENGDLLTGDLGVRDEDGYVWYHGRDDDLIVTSGYRVSPTEVEVVLELHSAVGKAIVGGIPDDRRGERIKAYIVPANDDVEIQSVNEELKAYVARELGPHKKPREIEWLSDVGRTRTGKTDRDQLFSLDPE